jgi:hypothetical protein
VPEQPLLDVLVLQWLAQQRIGAQVDHPGGQVITGAPVGVHFPQFILR